MTLAGFMLGLLLMGAGFLMVYKTNWFLQNMGDLTTIFGSSAPWMSWKVLGILLLLGGFLVGFGILQTFLALTVARLFTFGV